jgi:ribonuclease HI
MKKITIETIDATRRRPGYRKAFTTHIAATAEEAIAEDKEGGRDIVKVYADGSGFEGRVGVCAVLIRGTRTRTLKYCLGTLTEHTVYEAEAVGVLLGQHLLKEERSLRRVSINIDNQAVIKATDKHDPRPGHHLIDKILNTADELKRTKGTGFAATLRWIPGHKDVLGNELADKGAKEAAVGQVSVSKRLPRFLANGCGIPPSISAVRQAYMDKLTKLWKTRWKKSPRNRRIANIDPDLPSKSSTWKFSFLNKAESSIIVQLHTEHIALNAYLHRIKKSNTDLCPNCRETPETVHHFLFDCMAYGQAQHRRYQVLGRDSDSLRFLLADSKGIEQTILYINRTNRLRRVFGEISITKH